MNACFLLYQMNMFKDLWSVQIFGYLHTAWVKIGFTHGDLNCANVMEHRGDADLYLPRGFDSSDSDPKFKLPGDAPPCHVALHPSLDTSQPEHTIHQCKQGLSSFLPASTLPTKSQVKPPGQSGLS